MAITQVSADSVLIGEQVRWRGGGEREEKNWPVTGINRIVIIDRHARIFHVGMEKGNGNGGGGESPPLSARCRDFSDIRAAGL